jgi:hypothetical protein
MFVWCNKLAYTMRFDYQMTMLMERRFSYGKEFDARSKCWMSALALMNVNLNTSVCEYG